MSCDCYVMLNVSDVLEPARAGRPAGAWWAHQSEVHVMLQATAVHNDGIDGDRPCTSSPSAATPGSGIQNDLFPLLPPLLQPTQVRTSCRGGADLPKHRFVMSDFDFKKILS